MWTNYAYVYILFTLIMLISNYLYVFNHNYARLYVYVCKDIMQLQNKIVVIFSFLLRKEICPIKTEKCECGNLVSFARHQTV